MYTYHHTFEHAHGYVAHVIMFEPTAEAWWIFYRSKLYIIQYQPPVLTQSTSCEEVDLYTTRAYSRWRDQHHYPWWSIITIVILSLTCLMIWRSCKCRV
jgi:hypothetical protein